MRSSHRPFSLCRLLFLPIVVLLGLAELMLECALELLTFALELLSGVSGCSTDRAADPAFDLLGSSLKPVLGAFSRQILFSSIFAPLLRVNPTGARSAGQRSCSREHDHRTQAAPAWAGCGVLSA